MPIDQKDAVPKRYPRSRRRGSQSTNTWRSLDFQKELRLGIDRVRPLGVGRVRCQDLKDPVREVDLRPPSVIRGEWDRADSIPYPIVDVASEDLCDRSVVDGPRLDDPALGARAFDAGLQSLGDESLVQARSQVLRHATRSKCSSSLPSQAS